MGFILLFVFLFFVKGIGLIVYVFIWLYYFGCDVCWVFVLFNWFIGYMIYNYLGVVVCWEIVYLFCIFEVCRSKEGEVGS